MTNPISKEDYEAVPDVEAGVAATTGPSTKSREAVRATHPGLKDGEVDLLASLDEAIANKPTFAAPSLDPSDLQSKGKTILRSILQPTVTVVSSTVLAWLLARTAQSQIGFASFVIAFYPYLNAIAVFVSSYFPLADRFTDAISPVLQQMIVINRKAKKNVSKLGDQVDQTIDSIQVQINQVLFPYKKMFTQATQAETALRKLGFNADIPDPSDIDREIDEAQGKVGAALDEAKESINFEDFIPVALRSEKNFYWRIVMPAAVVACLLQLSLVAVSPKPTNASDNQLADRLNYLNETIESKTTALNSKLNDVSDLNTTIGKHTNLRGLSRTRRPCQSNGGSQIRLG